MIGVRFVEYLEGQSRNDQTAREPDTTGKANIGAFVVSPVANETPRD
jgi:hypothetical protein